MTAAIGALRTRIRLEKPVAAGNGAVVWVHVAHAWAAMSFTSPGVGFEIRRREVQAGWRVVAGGLQFSVMAVRTADDRGARLLIVCEEELR